MSIKATIFYVLFAFLLGAATVVGAFYLLDNCKTPADYVQVLVHNKSRFVVKELSLTYSGGKTVYTQQLAPNQTAFFAFPQQSEGSYTIVAQTTNNNLLEGGGGYIEPGYVEENTILDGHIINGTDLANIKPQ
jgi:hypothetical protein